MPNYLRHYRFHKKSRSLNPKMLTLLTLLLILAACRFYPSLFPNQEAEPKPTLALALLGQTIVIDAGHGGFDPGALGVAGTKEKDVNLAVSRRVADMLRQVGANVVETRTDDTALAETKREDMHRRVEIAEAAQADLFITVQANSIPMPEQRGAQVFYSAGSEAGQALAEAIQESLAQVLQNTRRQAKSIENVYVVRALAAPVVVVECGFLSNAEEEALLQDPRYQQLTAYAIFLGVLSFYADQPVTGGF